MPDPRKKVSKPKATKKAFKISKKLSSKAGKRTTARSFSETGYKAPSARAKKTWAYKKASRKKK